MAKCSKDKLPFGVSEIVSSIAQKLYTMKYHGHFLLKLGPMVTNKTESACVKLKMPNNN